MSAIVAYLDKDSIEDAGFDTSKITAEQFRLIKARAEKQLDASWNSIIWKACDGILDPLQD